MDNKKLARRLAITAALAFVTAPLTTAFGQAARHSLYQCQGGNSCKGQSACKTATNSCQGKNSCKGQGFVVVDDEAACKDLQDQNKKEDASHEDF